MEHRLKRKLQTHCRGPKWANARRALRRLLTADEQQRLTLLRMVGTNNRTPGRRRTTTDNLLAIDLPGGVTAILQERPSGKACALANLVR